MKKICLIAVLCFLYGPLRNLFPKKGRHVRKTIPILRVRRIGIVETVLMIVLQCRRDRAWRTGLPGELSAGYVDFLSAVKAAASIIKDGKRKHFLSFSLLRILSELLILRLKN